VDPFSPEAVRAAYDTVAEDYEAAFGDDIDRLPLERAMLDLAVATMPAGGTVLDLGCGTGSAGGYLAGVGAAVVGVDLSMGMLAVARSAVRLPVIQGDMRRLPFDDGVFGAVITYYSIQHVTRSQVAGALGEVARVLRTDGVLLVATHLGDGDVYSEEFLGHRIAPVGGALYSAEEVTGELDRAGFAVTSAEQRGPLAHEYPSQRIFLLARRARSAGDGVGRSAPGQHVADGLGCHASHGAAGVGGGAADMGEQHGVGRGE
jgi:ubiquinone/menaquinone biosynthesis C-methylase UbiE